MQFASAFLALAALTLAPLSAAHAASLSAVQGEQSEQVGQTDLQRAVTAFEQGEWQQVLDLVSAAPADSPDAPRLAYLAGETQLILGRGEAAAASFRKVLEQRPAAVPAQVGLARALTRTGEHAEAEVLLKIVLAAEPEDVGAKTGMGLLLAALGRFDEARVQLAGASRLAPERPLTARSHVEVLLRAGEMPEAAGVAEAFSILRPEHPMGPFLLAVVMERDGEDVLALGAYQAALAVDPNFLDAHKNLAILCHTLSDNYQDKVRMNLAFKHYERYFELGGSDPQLRTTYDSLLAYKEQLTGS